MDLFEAANDSNPELSAGRPLAERLRPRRWEDFQGQSDVRRVLGPYLANPKTIPNLIFWGPPGCGKTTLARILAEKSGSHFVNLNAVETGSKEIRGLGEEAHYRRLQGQGRTLVFIDEIHRLNRAQQDVLLPFTEAGDFVLIGATTENPSYELNSALLSRARVVVLQRLADGDLEEIFRRGCKELGFEPDQLLTIEAQERLLSWADGDARKLLTATESLGVHAQVQPPPFKPEDISEILQKPALRYDKKNDEHYDTISAFIKSVRGSDADAAIYYLARMLAGGEDPVFLARRLVILASEDIGNADPRGLQLAVAGLQAVELVGMPEAGISLAQVTTYLSSAPKSNASYMAYNLAKAEVENSGTLPIPMALRSSKTALNKKMGYGEGYKYAHDGQTGWQKMEFLPEQLKGKTFYEPTDHGFEKTIKQYMNWMKGKSAPQE